MDLSEAFRMMEAPSGISGSAFCTVDLDIGVECFVKVFFGDRSERDGFQRQH